MLTADSMPRISNCSSLLTCRVQDGKRGSASVSLVSMPANKLPVSHWMQEDDANEIPYSDDHCALYLSTWKTSKTPLLLLDAISIMQCRSKKM